MEVPSLDGRLGAYDVIYVSPHLDDAVCSCAAHIRSQRQLGKKVLVASVFTAGRDASRPVKASLEPFLHVEARKEEDREAMRELGVDYHHMGLPEALLRHGRGGSWMWGSLEVAWMWVSGLVRSESQVQDLLAQQLQQLLGKTQCPWIIGPAAIGLHPDHLIVHRACMQAADAVALPRVWHYYDFPYCTYPFQTWARRWALDVQGRPLQDVKPELTEEEVGDRKKLIAIYQSQIQACFGSAERLEAAVANYPDEHFLEAQRLQEFHQSVLPLPSIAKRSEDTALGILKRMLLVDLVISLLALYWVRHGLEWKDGDLRAMRFAYAVITLSALRVLCLAGKTSITVTWWLCVSSIFLIFAAFSYTAEVRSILLASYYSLQMWLGCAEQSFANHVKKAKASKSEGPMKVLMVSDYMPPQRHGIATHTHGLATALREEGCLVHIYTTTGKKDGSTFFTWSMQNPWNPDVRLSILPSFRLLKTIVGGQWSVVHVIFPNFLPWPVMLTAWLAGVPVYASQHCDLDKLGKVYVGQVLYWLSKVAYYIGSYLPIYLFSSIHAAPTKFFIEEHPVMRRFSKERLAVVPSSIDAGVFHDAGREGDREELHRRLGIPEDQVIWLVVARLAPEKDIDELLKVLKYYREQWPEEGRPPTLVIAGDGPLRSELEGIAKRDELPVRFLGFLTLPEVAKLYRACDVFVTNSVQETFGLTVIESLACGCPAVMPHCEVFDELYAGSLGDWMYAKGDVRSLANALRTASAPSAREGLATLRQGSLGKSLFWSWREAAQEQMNQYQQAQAMVKAQRARFAYALRMLLLVLSLLTLLIVCIVGLVSVGMEMKHIYVMERTAMLRHGRTG